MWSFHSLRCSSCLEESSEAAVPTESLELPRKRLASNSAGREKTPSSSKQVCTMWSESLNSSSSLESGLASSPRLMLDEDERFAKPAPLPKRPTPVEPLSLPMGFTGSKSCLIVIVFVSSSVKILLLGSLRPALVVIKPPMPGSCKVIDFFGACRVPKAFPAMLPTLPKGRGAQVPSSASSSGGCRSDALGESASAGGGAGGGEVAEEAWRFPMEVSCIGADLAAKALWRFCCCCRRSCSMLTAFSCKCCRWSSRRRLCSSLITCNTSDRNSEAS
mmetsp:Transcript_51531/g.130241  ORF Transcript_51531/g.130241 Transcript_51531/m.130241 type:complete len:275 (+) Transcript_51531:1498-2322(+)